MLIAKPVTSDDLVPFAGVVDLRRRSDGKLIDRLSFMDLQSIFTEELLEAVIFPPATLSPQPKGRETWKYLRVVDVAKKAKLVEPPKLQTEPEKPGHYGAALQCYYEEIIGSACVGTLGKVRPSPKVTPTDKVPRWEAATCIVPWTDRDGFNPMRFNPDRVSPAKYYAPLNPPLRQAVGATAY